MVCGYGCGQKASYSPRKGMTKWCCSSSWQKCPQKIKNISEKNKGRIKTQHEIDLMRKAKKDKSWEEIYGKEEAQIRRKKLIERQEGKTFEERFGYSKAQKAKQKLSIKNKNKHISKKQRQIISEYMSKRKVSKETRRKMSIGSKSTLKKLKEKWPFFSKVEEMRYNPDTQIEEREIQVHCKNHECKNSKEKGGWFTPDTRQIEIRIQALEKQIKFEQNYFYCSQKCKDTCILYDLKGDPYKNNDSSREIQPELRKMRLVIDNYTCQKCGKHQDELEVTLHCHHIEGIRWEPLESADLDKCITVCEDCHKEIHKIKGCEYHEMKCDK